LLLNPAGKPSEIYGEIAIKSKHVALGYWQNTTRTTAAFSTNGGGPTVRIYRTGDMGRRLPDGRIKFEGRKDFQVKIRVSGLSFGEIEGRPLAAPECARKRGYRQSGSVGRKASGCLRHTPRKASVNQP